MEEPPDEPIPRNSSAKSQLKLWRGRLVAIGIMSALLIVGLVLGVGPWVSRSYNESHRVTIECTVTEADGGKGSASGRGAASWSQVVIETSDCGTLVLVSGVDSSNRSAVAAELAEGGKFLFEIGEAARTYRGVYEFFRMTPEAWSFQKVQ